MREVFRTRTNGVHINYRKIEVAFSKYTYAKYLDECLFNEMYNADMYIDELNQCVIIIQ